MTPSELAPIAVIGGSGLYQLFAPDQSTVHEIATPYGTASVTTGQRAGRRVAFLPRHGSGHSVAPHLINYRANIWALASLGVRAIISSAAVGGINPHYTTGMLVVTDQFIDQTNGRPDTFFDRGSVQHLPAADPFDPVLRRVAIDALTALNENFAPTGTVLVIQGPRFSTRAESLWFRAAGVDIVNMTQYPEVVLASELNMGTVNLSFVTDADAGLTPQETAPAAESMPPHAPASADAATDAATDAPADAADAPGEAVTADLVFRRLAEAQPRILAAIDAILQALPPTFTPRALIGPEHVRAVLERDVEHHAGFELPPLNPPRADAGLHAAGRSPSAAPGSVPTPGNDAR